MRIESQTESVKLAAEEGPVEKFWKERGVAPLPLMPCKEGEEGFSWSDFINGLGQQAPQKVGSEQS
jgi:hypothetical protein